MTAQFYFKTIDIPNYQKMISEFNSYFDYFKDNFKISTDYFHKIPYGEIQNNFTEFNAWTTEKNLKLRTAAFIILNADMERNPNIHVDSLPANVALNFGLKIPEGSYTGMYKQLNGTIIENTQLNGIKRKLFIGASFKEECRFDLSNPTIFNTQIPHGVYTPKGSPRVSISFRFFNDLLECL